MLLGYKHVRIYQYTLRERPKCEEDSVISHHTNMEDILSEQCCFPFVYLFYSKSECNVSIVWDQPYPETELWVWSSLRVYQLPLFSVWSVSARRREQSRSSSVVAGGSRSEVCALSLWCAFLLLSSSSPSSTKTPACLHLAIFKSLPSHFIYSFTWRSIMFEMQSCAPFVTRNVLFWWKPPLCDLF